MPPHDHILGFSPATIPTVHRTRLDAHLAHALETAQAACTTFAQAHHATDAAAVNDALQQVIGGLEEHLAEQYAVHALHETATLHTLINTLHTTIPAKTQGLFLTEKAAARLLAQHPPTVLAQSFEKLIATSPCAALALTRHSEPPAWQDTYLAALKTLGPDAFEVRDIRIQTVDASLLAQALATSGQKEKPWRMSHNKETGYINCFTVAPHDLVPATLLQCIALLHHYYYETESAGRLLHMHHTDPAPIAVAMITSGAKRLPYFHPNTYSEHMFWEKALVSLAPLFPDTYAPYFLPFIAAGGMLSTDTEAVVSLNIVDQLWDKNLGQHDAARRYFGSTHTEHFLYHFREAMWFSALGALWEERNPGQDFRTLVLDHLHLGDTPLTEKVLS